MYLKWKNDIWLKLNFYSQHEYSFDSFLVWLNYSINTHPKMTQLFDH